MFYFPNENKNTILSYALYDTQLIWGSVPPLKLST